MTPWPRENNDMKNMKANKDMQSSIFFSKPCQVIADQSILREFYRKRLVEAKTQRGYCYLCTACCHFVPLNRNGLTCLTKHRRLLLQIYEHELASVRLSSENDRSRVLRKSSLNGLGLENKTIERSVSSSSVKKLVLDKPKPKMPRMGGMIVAS